MRPTGRRPAHSRPRRTHSSSPSSRPPLRTEQAQGRRANVVTPGDFTGYGFDQCLAPTQRAMDAWLKNSPFLAVGIYISGDSRACRNQPNLTPTWISTQLRQRLAAAARSPSARRPPASRASRATPTTSRSARRPADSYATARAQGVVEADKNATDAAALGIAPGSTLWYDLEGFNLSDTHCRESALAFLSAWVTRIKELGYVAGVYSSAGSGIKMLDDARISRPGQFALPDRIWIARWDGIANTSTTYIREDGWRPGGRMKQYKGGHNETWGGVTINIDSNYLDLGAGSQPTPESHCGGIQVAFWKYPALTTTAAKSSRVKVLQCLLNEQGSTPAELGGDYDADRAPPPGRGRPKDRFTAAARSGRARLESLLAGGDASGPEVRLGRARRAPAPAGAQRGRLRPAQVQRPLRCQHRGRRAADRHDWHAGHRRREPDDVERLLEGTV